jgi:actin cytoskeleton-regulatory complex protein PAN1
MFLPVQRITRYPLLIKQILHHTEIDTELRDIERALDMSEKILENINESIRDQEGYEKLRDLSQYLWIGQG